MTTIEFLQKYQDPEIISYFHENYDLDGYKYPYKNFDELTDIELITAYLEYFCMAKLEAMGKTCICGTGMDARTERNTFRLKHILKESDIAFLISIWGLRDKKSLKAKENIPTTENTATVESAPSLLNIEKAIQIYNISEEDLERICKVIKDIRPGGYWQIKNAREDFLGS